MLTDSLGRPALADAAKLPLNTPEKTTSERQCHDRSRQQS